MSARPPFDEENPTPAPDPLWDAAEGGAYQAGDKKQVKAAEKRQVQVEAARKLAMRALLATPDGRTWLYWLLFDPGMCNVLGTSENAAFDAGAVHYREGQRIVGITLQSLALSTSREHYTLMLQEHLGVDL